MGTPCNQLQELRPWCLDTTQLHETKPSHKTAPRNSTHPHYTAAQGLRNAAHARHTLAPSSHDTCKPQLYERNVHANQPASKSLLGNLVHFCDIHRHAPHLTHPPGWLQLETVYCSQRHTAQNNTHVANACPGTQRQRHPKPPTTRTGAIHSPLQILGQAKGCRSNGTHESRATGGRLEKWVTCPASSRRVIAATAPQ